MKKYLIALLFLATSLFSQAELVVSETVNNIKARVTNQVSPWYETNADNVGLGLKVDVGSCKVEISLDMVSSCKNNTATAFDWDAPVLTAGQKQFLSYTSGISCVRADCTSGSALFFVRRR